jgi:hypothetical protein
MMASYLYAVPTIDGMYGRPDMNMNQSHEGASMEFEFPRSLSEEAHDGGLRNAGVMETVYPIRSPQAIDPPQQAQNYVGSFLFEPEEVDDSSSIHDASSSVHPASEISSSLELVRQENSSDSEAALSSSGNSGKTRYDG